MSLKRIFRLYTKEEREKLKLDRRIILKEEFEELKCKTCFKNPRRNGSAYCKECSLNYHSGL